MFYFLVSVNIIALILMLFMLSVCLHKKLSKAQLAFIIYDIFTMLFVVGVHLELVHSDTVGEALAGLCIQYVGQAGFLMAFLWFASEFGRLKIPKFVYFIGRSSRSGTAAWKALCRCPWQGSAESWPQGTYCAARA